MTDHAVMSGADASRFIETRTSEQVQPSGIDLTVENLLKPSAGFIRQDDKAMGKREQYDDQGEHWIVDEAVIVKYGEVISIPTDHIGLVLPRSTLMRNGCELHTAIWDPGYSGKGEGLLVPHTETVIEQGARIAQMILVSSDADETYNEEYQGEGLEEFADQ